MHSLKLSVCQSREGRTIFVHRRNIWTKGRPRTLSEPTPSSAFGLTLLPMNSYLQRTNFHPGVQFHTLVSSINKGRLISSYKVPYILNSVFVDKKVSLAQIYEAQYKHSLEPTFIIKRMQTNKKYFFFYIYGTKQI